jgi:transcriptional regulator with XRE-family HTH domain
MVHNKYKAGTYREPTRDMLTISYHLRKARYWRGISILALSGISGYAHKTIRSWEEGRSVPSVKAFVDWADSLGYDIVLYDRSTGDILTPLGGRVKVSGSTIGDTNDPSRYDKVG